MCERVWKHFRCALLFVALCLSFGSCKKDGAVAPGAGGKTDPTAAPAATAQVTVQVTNESSFALLPSGVVRAWGSNAYGQLGALKINDDAATAVEVKGLTDVEKLYIGGGNLTATGCAQVKGGLVKCWGDSDLIPGANNDSTDLLEVPSLKGIKTMCLGSGFAAAVKPDGTLLTWGYNAFGVLGNGQKDQKTVREPTVIAGVTDVVEVGCGQNHGCARHGSGKVSCWGNNFDGQADPPNMGYGKDVYAPKVVEGITDAVVLGVSANVSCVIGKDKSIKCWGANIREKAPKPIPNSTGAIAMSSGHGDHTCFIKEGGEAWCWGKNTFGEAGVDPEQKRDLQAIPTKVEGLSNVVSISTSYNSNHTCASTKDGKVFCFGRNRYGALGDGTLNDSFKPKEVPTATATALPPPKDGFDQVPTRGTPTAWPESLPKGCTKPTALTAKFELEPKITSFPIVFAEAAVSDRKHAEETGGQSYEIMLRTYAFDPKASIWDYDQQPRGLQASMRISLTADKVTEVKKDDKTEQKRTALAIKVGDYELGTLTAPVRREASVQGVVRRHTVWFGPGWNKSYKGVKVTYVGDDFICGELTLENEKSSLKGSFAAPLKKK
jgi:alpha-tubulin suppressor-like RCC1 family protein